MQHRPARRRFLGSAFATAASAALPAPLVAAPRETIAIVGAGMAGLVAAHRLREAGRRVIVLEARTRPGGRVRTLHLAGRHGEAGAARIADNHQAVQRWVAAAGLELIPFAPPGSAPLLAVDGLHGSTTDIGAWTDRLPPGERGLSFAALLQNHLADLPPDIADPDPDAASYDRWRALDATSWPRFLAARGASSEAIRLLTAGADSRALSALYVLRQIALHRGVRRYYKIAGGMDRLPRTLAARLGSALYYGHAVRHIAQDGRGIRLLVASAGTTRTLEADRLVLAIPVPLLRAIAVSPALSPAKRAAIATLAYYPAARLLLPCAAAWARTDRPAEIWDAAYGEVGGLASITVGGAIGDAMGTLGVGDCLAVGRACLADAFPDTACDPRSGAVQRWAQDPWSRGAYAAFAPGTMATLMPAAAEPEGRIHFAGEHTSSFMSWMEGAVRSGERVAEEILAKG